MLQSSFEFREEQQIMFFLDDWKALARAFRCVHNSSGCSITTAALTLTERNNVVKALPSDLTDQSFSISVLPRATRRRCLTLAGFC
jgi:hypothetical protein